MAIINFSDDKGFRFILDIFDSSVIDFHINVSRSYAEDHFASGPGNS